MGSYAVRIECIVSGGRYTLGQRGLEIQGRKPFLGEYKPACPRFARASLSDGMSGVCFLRGSFRDPRCVDWCPVRCFVPGRKSVVFGERSLPNFLQSFA